MTYNISLNSKSTNLSNDEYTYINNNSVNGFIVNSKQLDCVGYNPTISIEGNNVSIASDLAERNPNIGSIDVSINLNNFNTYFSLSVSPDSDSESEILDILDKHNWTLNKSNSRESVIDDELDGISDFVGESFLDKKKKKPTRNSLSGFFDGIGYLKDYNPELINGSVASDDGDTTLSSESGECSGTLS